MSVLEGVLTNIAARAYLAEDGVKIPHNAYKKVDPVLRRASKWAGILENFDTDKPFSIVNPVKSIIHELVEKEKVKKFDPIKRFLDQRADVRMHDCLEWLIEYEMSHRDLHLDLDINRRRIYHMMVDEYKVYLILAVDKEDEDIETLEEIWLRSSEQEKLYEVLAESFWKNHESVEMTKQRDEYHVSDCKLDDREYRGSMLNFVERQYEIAQKHRRVIILQGEPGTGKSTLCASVAKHLTRRNIIIQNTMLESVSRVEWETVMRVLRPNLVIIDDLDRIQRRSLEKSLPLFEDKNYKIPLTLITTNDFSKMPAAFRRPGRVDVIMEMPNPTRDIIRDEILEQFKDDLGIEEDIPDETEEWFIDLMEKGIPGAAIKELLIRHKSENWNYEIPENDLGMGHLNDTPAQSHDLLGR